MVGVNKVILIGNLGKDPELRYTPNSTAVASFPLATTERFTDKNGQRQERTEWHNIVAWSKLGELANQYLKKGRSAYIEGRISTRSWDDRDGNKKYKTEIVANQIQFLSGTQRGGEEPPAETEAPYESNMQPSPAAQTTDGGVDDDLPF